NAQIDGVKKDLATLGHQIDATTDPTELDNLQAQRDSLVARLGVLQQQLSTLVSNATVAQGTAAQIVQRAEVPTSPSSPNKARNGVLALFAGVMLGIGFAFLRERLDDRVKGRQDIERRLSAPVLAVVPKVGAWRKDQDAYLALESEPKSPVSEAYRTLGTNLQYLSARQGMKVFLLTSPLAGDGKTTTCANLAVALAQAGRRVIVVSADLRKPRIHRFFGL